MEVRTGRKWHAQEAVDQAETRLRHNILLGRVATGRARLGSTPTPCYSKARGKERQRLIRGRCRLKNRRFTSAGWWAWASRGLGPCGSILLARKTPGQNYGRSHSNSSSWSRQHTMSSPYSGIWYRWHHAQVLRAVADTICTSNSSSRSQHPTKNPISFVHAAEKP